MSYRRPDSVSPANYEQYRRKVDQMVFLKDGFEARVNQVRSDAKDLLGMVELKLARAKYGATLNEMRTREDEEEKNQLYRSIFHNLSRLQAMQEEFQGLEATLRVLMN